MLKEYGANGWTKVHIAAENNNTKLLKKLAAKGYDLNKPNDEGQSPAHIAVEYCNLQSLEVLSECGADLHQTNDDKQTPLEIAKYNVIVNGSEKWIEVKKFLQKWNASQSLKTREDRVIREAAYLIQRKFRRYMKIKRTKDMLRKKFSIKREQRPTNTKRKLRSPETDSIAFVSPAKAKKVEIDPIDLIPMTTLSMFEQEDNVPKNRAKARINASLTKKISNYQHAN